MKNKRAILGTIFLIIVIILFIMGAFIYYQIKTSGLTVSTGKVTINIAYNNSPEKTETNNSKSKSNETAENISSDYLIIYENDSLGYENITNWTSEG